MDVDYDKVTKVDEPLTLTDGSFEDWFVIERRVHDGRAWFERTGPHSSSLCLSSRIGNADIEGDAEEMLSIADAIKTRGAARHKRCAAKTTPDGVELWSPRNSIGRTLVPLSVADALAEEITQKLATPERSKGGEP